MANKKTSKKKKGKYKLLKKIARGIYYLISKIYNIIDKIIITPLAKVMLFFMKPFKNSGKSLDRVLNNKLVLITLSLIIAFAAFLIVDRKTEMIMNNTADILYNQKVKALYNEEAYVVEGLPKKVDVTLIGRKADLYLAKQYPSDEVVVDLRDYKPGKHEVNLKYSGSVTSVEYKPDPSTAVVTIYEKISVKKKVNEEILNEDSINPKYNISDVSFSREEVYVKGAEYKLDQIATVKALVDLKNLNKDAKKGEYSELNIGTTTLKEIPLVAYDEKGSKLDVEIVPATLDASIEITSPNKEVPLKAIPTGNVVFGKAIDDIKLSSTKATIYGDEKALEKISYIPVDINVEGIKKATEFTVNLSLPSGVNEISTKSVVAEVTLGDIKQKTIKNVNIATKNLSPGLKAQAASQLDSTATIIVKGTSNNLKDISSENISAYVDLQGLEKGTHKVEVKVSGDDLKLSYLPKTKTVTIIIK